ncbi:MAG: hypothetical protein WBF06_04415 [Candidatus Acidiferrales bacterium]
MKRISLAGLLLAALFCVPAARSQQSTPDQGTSTPAAPDQPLPAPNTTPSSGSTNDAGAAPAGRSLLGSDAADQSPADTLPLSGAQQLTIPGTTEPTNFFDASALFSGSGDSGVINAQKLPTWGASEVAGGEITVDRSWNADRFALSYSGGGLFYQPSALYPDAMFHTLSVGQQFAWKRLTLRLMDQFSYSPTSLFGGAGLGGPGLLAETGQTTTPLSPIYGVSDTILTGESRVVNNSAVGEIQYNFSLRSSFTVTGSYGVLDYEGGGYISSHDYVVSAGYNYALTPKDALAATYSFTQTQFTGAPENLSFEAVNLAYSHQVSGRLVFQISAGPEFTEFHNYTPSVGNAVGFSVDTGLQYRLRRSSFGAAFSRGDNAGSGVFFGSVSDSVTGNVSHQFSRFLTGVVYVGYSKSGSLVSVPGVANEFHDWFIGASLGRQFGRYTHLSFNYGAEQQPSDGICPVTSCGTNQVVQTIGVALDLHIHPIGTVE